jgi:hypothetical protein
VNPNAHQGCTIAQRRLPGGFHFHRSNPKSRCCLKPSPQSNADRAYGETVAAI